MHSPDTERVLQGGATSGLVGEANGGRRKRYEHAGRFGRVWEDRGRKEGRGEEKDNSCHNIRISTMASPVTSPHHHNITLHTATRRLVGLLVSGQKRPTKQRWPVFKRNSWESLHDQILLKNKTQ